MAQNFLGKARARGRAGGPRAPGNSCAARLEEAKRRLAEQHALERHAIEAEQAASTQWLAEQRERGRKPTGRRRIHPLVVSQQPAGRVNVTDPDSRPVKTTRGFIQGYSGQAAATEDQIIVDSTQRKAGRSTASASGSSSRSSVRRRPTAASTASYAADSAPVGPSGA